MSDVSKKQQHEIKDQSLENNIANVHSKKEDRNSVGDLNPAEGDPASSSDTRKAGVKRQAEEQLGPKAEDAEGDPDMGVPLATDLSMDNHRKRERWKD